MRQSRKCFERRTLLASVLTMLPAVTMIPRFANADEHATTSPATAPAIRVKVTIDTSAAPETADWAADAKTYVEKWYPRIAQRLATDGFSPPDHVKLVFSKTYDGVAATSGTTVTISAKWITDHPDDLGMVAHEITHVIQHYTKPNRAGWLVEGIADYIRYYFVEPGTPKARFDLAHSNWNSAYQPSAAFLDYLETSYPDVHVVEKLNTALREGTYSNAMINRLTGKDPDTLWAEYKKAKKSESPR